jgi:hypothetical protein
MNVKANDGTVGFSTIWQIENAAAFLRPAHAIGWINRIADVTPSILSVLSAEENSNRPPPDGELVGLRLPQWLGVGKARTLRQRVCLSPRGSRRLDQPALC